MTFFHRDLVVWVLRLVAVDVTLLALWMVIDGPHASTVSFVQGYAGANNRPPSMVRALLRPPPMHGGLLLGLAYCVAPVLRNN